MRKLTIQICLLLCLLSNLKAELNFHEYVEPTSLGTSGGINFYTIIAGEVSSGWTDTNSPSAIYYMQDTNGAVVIEDSSGNGLDGAPKPSVATGPTYTNLGARTNASGDEIARAFDGINDYVSYSDNNLWSFGNASTDTPFSMGFWHNSRTTTAKTVITKRSSANGEYRINAGGDIVFELWDATFANRIAIKATAVYSSNTWAHIVCTYDGSGLASGMKIYLNGVLQSVTSIGAGTYTAMHNTTYPVTMGAKPGAEFLDGILDDFRMYRKELTADEVTDIYSRTLHPLGSLEERLTP